MDHLVDGRRFDAYLQRLNASGGQLIVDLVSVQGRSVGQTIEDGREPVQQEPFAVRQLETIEPMRPIDGFDRLENRFGINALSTVSTFDVRAKECQLRANSNEGCLEDNGMQVCRHTADMNH